MPKSIYKAIKDSKKKKKSTSTGAKPRKGGSYAKTMKRVSMKNKK